MTMKARTHHTLAPRMPISMQLLPLSPPRCTNQVTLTTNISPMSPAVLGLFVLVGRAGE